MRVAVEEPVPEDHRHPGFGDDLGESFSLLDGVAGLVDVRELEALDELERQNASACVAPVDARDVDVRVAGEVAVERLGVAGFEAVVELLPDRAGELVHDLTDVHEVERPDAFLGDARGLVEEPEVGLDLLRGAGALHLDRDLVAVREDCAVDLADRGGGDRLTVELEEEALDREREVFLDHALDVLVREGPHVVLEPAELGDDVGRQDVRPHREQLAELDEGRAELVEELAEVPAPLGGGALGELAAVAPAGQQVGQLVALEEVAEAVPDGDLGDLRQPAEIPRLRRSLSHDQQCSMRNPEALFPRCQALRRTTETEARTKAARRPRPGGADARAAPRGAGALRSPSATPGRTGGTDPRARPPRAR